LLGVATDVLNGTLEDSFALHLRLAREAGVSDAEVRAAILLISEFGMAKAWRALSHL
jgi:hypothetical protein